MLYRPEPIKERVEPTFLRIIAIEIRHLTRFALLLLLWILRYMWRNHVATWAEANKSGRNLDLNKIRFAHLHYILQYSFWFGFESQKLKSCYWYLEKTQGHSITLKAASSMGGLQPRWPLVLRSLQLVHAFYTSIYLEVIAVLHYNNHDGVIHACVLTSLYFIEVQ